MTRAEKEFAREFPEWEINKGNQVYVLKLTGYLAGWKRRGELDAVAVSKELEDEYLDFGQPGLAISKLDEQEGA